MSLTKLCEKTTFLASTKSFGKHDWGMDHYKACKYPANGFEKIYEVIIGLAEWADAYYEKFETPIGHDYVLGVYFREAVIGAHKLLDGDHGRLDAGTISSMVHDLLIHAGYDQGID